MHTLLHKEFWAQMLCHSSSAYDVRWRTNTTRWCVKVWGSLGWYLSVLWSLWSRYMMRSSNGSIFRVTVHLWTSDAELYVFFDLRLNKFLSKQWRGWWCETQSRPLYIIYQYNHFNSWIRSSEFRITLWVSDISRNVRHAGTMWKNFMTLYSPRCKVFMMETHFLYSAM